MARMTVNSGNQTVTIEVRYLSMNKTHLQVEFVDNLGMTDEYWIPFNAIQNRDELNILDDIMELTVTCQELEQQGLAYVGF